MLRVPESIFLSNKVEKDPDDELPKDPVYKVSLVGVTPTSSTIECLSNVECTDVHCNMKTNHMI